MSRAFRSSVMVLLLLLVGSGWVFAQATATITVTGTEQPAAGGWDTSNISITVNGYTETYQYGQYSTANSVASALSAMFSRDDYRYGLSTGVGVNGTGPNVITLQLNNGQSFSQVSVSGPNTSFSISASGFTSQTTPAISWAPPAAISYGTALATTQLNATASVAGTLVPGTFSYSPAAGTIPPAGAETLTATFTPTDTTHYTTATASVTLTVNQATPTLSVYCSPSPITSGSQTTTCTANAGSGATGTVGFTYNGTSWGNVGLSGGAASVSGLNGQPVNSYNIVANYLGDANNNPSSGNATLTIQPHGSEGITLPGLGIINTVAGNGILGNSGDGGLATNAELHWPEPIAVDASGNIYIPDRYNQTVRKVSASTGDISTVAGTTVAGYGGDSGPATSAQLNYPAQVAVDTSGNLYIADNHNSVIRKVAFNDGTITTVAGIGTAGYTGDGGVATSAQLNYPFGVAVDGSGKLYIADTLNGAIRKVTFNGSSSTITTVAGNPSQSPAPIQTIDIRFTNDSCSGCSTGDTVPGEDRNLFVNSVTAGSTVVTPGASSASFTYVYPGCVDSCPLYHDGEAGLSSMYWQGDLIVTNPPAGSPITINAWSSPDHNVYAHMQVYLNGVLAGEWDTTAHPQNYTVYPPGSYIDGQAATSAQLYYPSDLAVDSPGNLYFVDGSRVAKVTFDSNGVGTITTVAGNGIAGYSPDGTVATSAAMMPGGVVVDPSGNLYISDNNVVRKVTYSGGVGTLTTVAGNGTTGFNGDGISATSAELEAPYGLALDSAGYLYIEDGGVDIQDLGGSPSLDNPRIRVVGPTTITPSISWSAPAPIQYGTALTNAQLNASSPVPGVFSYSSALGTVLPLGTNTLTVTFTPAATTQYATVTKSVNLTVTQATPVITWVPPAPVPYGTILGTAQLSATTGVDGILTYSPAAGSTPTAGTNTLTVSFAPTDTIHYAATTASVPLSVTQATPVITWNTPASITYGTALSGAQLNASTPVPGTFTYTPDAGSIPGAGAGTLTATFTPTDTTDYITVISFVSLSVTQDATPAQLAIWSDNSPSSPGSMVRLSTTITSGDFIANDNPYNDSSPSGTVTFYDGSTQLGTVDITQNSTVSNLLCASELIVPNTGCVQSQYWMFQDGSGYPAQVQTVSSPSGTASASQLTDAGPGISYVGQMVGIGTNSPGQYTSSVWLQSNNPSACGGLQLSTFGPYMNEGTSTSPTIGRTWQRYSVTGEIDLDDFAEIGVAVPPGCTVSMWGAQLEHSSSMGPYQYESHDAFCFIIGPNTCEVATATYSTSALSPGAHAIRAVYSGDSNGNLTSTAEFTQYVGGIPTSNIFDSGTVTLSVAGVSASTSYGQGSDGPSIASGLAYAFSQLPNSPVNVTAFSDMVELTASQPGVAYTYSLSTTYDSTNFSTPSFTFSPSSGKLAAGTGEPVPATVYRYTVPTNGYDTNGNVLAYTDSVMGSWSFGYDQLNRLVTAANSGGAVPARNWAQNFCWAYDSFGNRLAQSTSDVAFTQSSGTCATTGTLYQNVLASYNPQNQMTSTNAPGFTLSPPGYDDAGDVTDDGRNQYLYDAEGRICAVSGVGGMFGYLYDAAGGRVAKGTIQLVNGALSCDVSANGFYQTAGYVVGPSGEQLTEVDSSERWVHTNLYAGGKLIGTFDTTGLHFHLEDPLGTRRAQVNSQGELEATYQSLPFGDGFLSTGNDDPTENHFTGKERDQETGNDYFGARYYASSMGRWLSPDWSAKVEPVPYAKLDQPQSLNLYAYVGNDPVTGIDPDGHLNCSSYDGNTAACVNDAASSGNAPSDGSWLTQEAQQQNNDPAVAAAEDYLTKSKVARGVIKGFNKTGVHIELNSNDDDRYNPNTRTVYWDPNSAWKTTDGGHQTPALGLLHEMEHATVKGATYDKLHGIQDPAFDNKEEQRVILHYENPVAKELGESTRSNHDGTPYPVTSPTSVIPLYSLY